MAYVFVACPECGAGYKIAKEHLTTEAVCRACGHRWVPAEARAAKNQGGPGGEAASPPSDQAEAAAAAASDTPPSASPAEGEPAKTAEGSAPADERGAGASGGAPADALAALAAAAGETKGSKPASPSEPASGRESEGKAGSGKAPGDEKAGAKPAAGTQAAGGGDARLDALEAMARAAGGKGTKAPKPPAGKTPAKGTASKARPTPADAEADPLIGRQINGFKVQARLGTGGFGIVYRAFDTNLERSIAIKMLPANLAKAGQGVVERFLREARSAAKLAHPNIVTIHQICPYKNTYYIVMELIDDGALHDVLGKKRTLHREEATRIVRAAAEGLGHAHTRGIIHRDIKPGNIMLTSDGQVKVSDFGLARDVLQGQDIVGAGHSLGTPRYMAPEQALGEEPTAASDLYSLAATYFVLLTGHAPFDGTDEREIMKKQVQAPVPDPRSFRPELPAAAFRFFEKAMAKEPADRYCVAQDFIEALDRLDFAKADSDLTDSQDLVDQLGAAAAADRGSHLSQTLGRAVKRAQRQRTPMSESAVDEVLGAGTAVGRKAGWRLWLLIGVLALLVVGGAVAAAILLAPGDGEPGRPETGKEAGTTPSGKPETGQTPPETAGTETPTEGPTEEPPAEKPPTSPLEDVAQEVLKEVRAYEGDPDTPIYELMRMYRENVMQVYPGTQAAEEAAKAIERLKGGKRLQDAGGGETPAEETPGEAQPAEGAPAEGT
ncbi:MAG: protein kinase [Phycisphaerae bacterium]